MLVLALAVAGYALFGFFFGVPLLKSKPTEVLNNVLWRVAFFGHMGLGAVALGTGGFQFFEKWRQRRPQLHRRLGRVYLVAVALSGVAALVAAQNATGGWVTRLGFSTLAVLWLLTAALAFYHIRQGRVAEHRVWMRYNYACTLAAVSLRIWLPLLIGGVGMTFLEAYQWVAWISWLPHLVIVRLTD
jgi:uncharacterized membrane protein